MLEKHYRGRRRRGQIGQRNNNHYFVASEHGSEAAPQRGRGKQSAQGFGKAALLPIFSGFPERNKMTEVLLRWPGSAAGTGLPVSTENLVSKKHVSEPGKNFLQFTKAGLSPRGKSGGTGCGCSGLHPGHLLRGNAAADEGPGGIKKARSFDRACAVHGHPCGRPPEERNGPRLIKIAHPGGEVKPPDNFRTTAGQGRAFHGPLVLALRRRIQWESGGGGKREAVR